MTTQTAHRNRDFRDARKAKKDEFYTQLVDIQRELHHYCEHFKDKIVYCNCDDPRESNFFRYFFNNFKELGIKKLIATGYTGGNAALSGQTAAQKAFLWEYHGVGKGDQPPGPTRIGLKGNGDFRSDESIELLKQADIVITNPPFSLFREYVAQLFEHKKKFLIIGNMNALTYKEIFPRFQKDEVWYGPSIRSGDREFGVPDDYPLTAVGSRIDAKGNKFIRVKGVRWFTNLDYPGRHQDLALHKTYTPHEYPRYANFDAIEVGKTMETPMDYDGPMGVPITFLDKYNPDQFEIIGSSKSLGRPMSEVAAKGTYQQGGPRFYLANDDGTYRRMYDRIVIRNKRL